MKKILIVGYGQMREFVYESLLNSKYFDLYLLSDLEEDITAKFFVQTFKGDLADFDACKKLLSGLQIEFDYIVSFLEDRVLLASQLQTVFCFSELNVEGVNNSSVNKFLMREKLASKSYSVQTIAVDVSSLKAFTSSLEGFIFPCVVKPNRGVNSLGVYKINSQFEIPKIFNEIKIQDFPEDLDFQAEEYFGGQMYSADGFVLNSQVSEILLTRQYLGPEPQFTLETTLAGFADWRSIRDQFKDIIHDVLSNLGLNNTLFHMEFKIQNGEFKLIEVAARSAGGPILRGYDRALGVNLPLAFLSSMFNLAYKIQPQNKGVLVMHAEYAKSDFVLQKLENNSLIELLDFIPLSEIGKEVTGYPNKPDALYVVNFFAENQSDPLGDLKRVTNNILLK